MNITVSKVKRLLEKNHGWDNIYIESQKSLINQLIKDVLRIIDTELKTHKGISIKNK